MIQSELKIHDREGQDNLHKLHRATKSKSAPLPVTQVPTEEYGQLLDL